MVPGGSLYVSTYKIYGHTNRKWSICNVRRCLCLKKSPFFATNTHMTVTHGPAKENKFNTILCIGKSAIGAKKSQPKTYRYQSNCQYQNGMQQQLKKVGIIIHYLDKFNHNWSLHTPRARGQTALQSKPLERGPLSFQDFHPGAYGCAAIQLLLSSFVLLHCADLYPLESTRLPSGLNSK